ncbi:glycosyltransferase 87 family protein [Yinghuangia seranimata]|uniref:glycosyltransferase 87 family protein n=1 Tax=Yinghuangia seranimata TaxID=408067 RepID=UPI00248C754F|nr:glycosyltransferase 87 family protein [Yinghuangia seranimata]MDI2129706.1 glycosyltransferase 87 family protein [Yinghuangia seranimata]
MSLSARIWLPVGVLIAGIAGAAWVWTVRHHPDLLWRLLDLQVYDDAAASLSRAQHRLYTHRFGDAGLPFIYPPFAALVFYKLPLGFAALKLLVTGLTLGGLAAVVWVSWGMLGHRRDAGRVGATLAVTGAALWLEPVQQTLAFGQVNVILMAAVVLDLAQPDRRPWKGAGVGLATGFKLTPAIFIAYLLVTRRFRAAAVATGTFLATVAAGWALIPGASRTYWFGAIDVGDNVGQDFISNQSFNGMLRRLLGSGPAEQALWLLLAGATAVVGLAAAALLSRRGRELAGVVTCGVTGLLVSPISWTHHWVWAAPLLVLLTHTALVRGARAAGPARRALWAALPVGLVLLAFAWPMARPGTAALTPQGLLWRLPYEQGREHRWTALQTLLGNGYLLAGAALVATAAGLAARAAPRTSEGDAVAARPRTDTVGASVNGGGSPP